MSFIQVNCHLFQKMFTPTYTFSSGNGMTRNIVCLIGWLAGVLVLLQTRGKYVFIQYFFYIRLKEVETNMLLHNKAGSENNWYLYTE